MEKIHPFLRKRELISPPLATTAASESKGALHPTE